MATVLILASDRLIGGLLGQLTDLTGHAAQFRSEGEDLSAAVRQSAPDIVMLDAAYGRRALDAVAAAATEVGVPIVYFATSIAPGELRRLALERKAKYFALPAGPKLLARILSAALDDHRPVPRLDGFSLAQYAVTAASAAVARARALVNRSSPIKTESLALRAEHEAALAASRRTYADLREAVIAYTRELRGAGVPPDRTLAMIKTAMQGEGNGAHSGPNADREIDDAVEWCLQAYYAA